MKLLECSESSEEFSPEFKREFVEKILIREKSLRDLASELGLPPDLLHKWTLKAGHDQTACPAQELCAPSIRILELERDIEDLRHELEHQARTIQLLESQ